jgi:hypothetical protein
MENLKNHKMILETNEFDSEMIIHQNNFEDFQKEIIKLRVLIIEENEKQNLKIEKIRETFNLDPKRKNLDFKNGFENILEFQFYDLSDIEFEY